MKSPSTLPTRLPLLHPTGLVILTLGTLVGPTMEATNNGGPAIALLHPINVDLPPPPTLMMVFTANCATNQVMLQVCVDQNLTIILRQRSTMFQDCRHQQILGLSTLEHLIISLLNLTTCRHTMAWSMSPWVMDLNTGTPLVHGRSRDGLYEWPTSPSVPSLQAHVASSNSSSIITWHRRLDLPPPIILTNADTIRHTHDTVSSGCAPTESAIPGTFPTFSPPLSSLPDAQSYPLSSSIQSTQLPSTSHPPSPKPPIRFVYSRRSTSAATTNTSAPTFPEPHPSPLPPNRVVTRSQHNIHKPKLIFDYMAHLPPLFTPSTFNQASKHIEW
ncbi:hypothetical protein KY284_020110 [Solanum tuberosum]|nr:hypothetical protein KY284_020110 [Solanum tuberosum]